MKLGHLPMCVDEISNTEQRVLTIMFQTRIEKKNTITMLKFLSHGNACSLDILQISLRSIVTGGGIHLTIF